MTPAVELQWQTHNAEVWQQDQVIRGKIDTIAPVSGILHWKNGSRIFAINPLDSSFFIEVKLDESENWFVATIENQGETISSDTLRLLMKLPLKPILEAYATVANREVTLHGRIVENPDSEAVAFFWSEDGRNPASFGLNEMTDSLLVFNVSEEVPDGEYYFNLAGVTARGDTARARTFITISHNGVQPFDIRHDHAAWIDSAVIYEISPYAFVMEGTFQDIQQKLPELRELGINTIWLQPIFKTTWGEQGYDVIDYFTIRSDYGTESDLRNLIKSAHTLGVKVILDIVINHTSIYHPYAQHSIEYGNASHYYDYYQREIDNAPYSQYYNYYKGFINYFWDELPNLNYDNPEVRNWMMTACKYWVEKFDIDGYRFDAVWGVNARCPEFTQNLRLALKRIKPEIMMLAEDKASWPMVFDQRFDVAFDWAPSEDWVSQWYWEVDYSENATKQYTIFNYSNPSGRVSLLRQALTNNGQGYAANAKILRYMGNNDMIPFIKNHNLAQTKMVATLIFALNGVPMIYNGQEIGYNQHPYSSYQIFQRGKTIRSQDKYGLFDHYRYLIQIRQKYPALRSDYFREIPVVPDYNAFAFQRRSGDENLFGVINMMSTSKNITITLPIEDLNLDSTKNYYLSDLITGTVYSGKPENLSTVAMTIPGYTTSLFLLADSIVNVNIVPEERPPIAEKFTLFPNYPNPFNPSTTIRYTIPQKGNVKLTVLDLLGREVMQLVDGEQTPGEHRILIRADQLASGCYFYRLKYQDQILVGKMLLLK
ncbi:MAG TPA: alpha-amylase family glycosyl hydrolase [Candidatus Marinimicrobia bacterium]|mgnify:CR=1 FL=1|nr:alpha-amylase family glycosyl hydrolase [Candidatus Neomarinimicrobiota bacterium]HRS51213.1 alpha-amylase family glycosyl hydrolase [Candidatus Neomarinimicrobiota bacterium]HRU91549.1 alpha-amylase family glycosyl hydrolase [Candidatus Neomarinimicrobiota bacterium]